MTHLSRREWIGAAGLGIASLASAHLIKTRPAVATASPDTLEPYSLPPLPWPANALEPVIDARTVRIHHDKHHAGYVRGLNRTLRAIDEARAKKDFSSMQKLCRALAFHGSGHVLHTLYFANLTPAPRPPKGALAAAIRKEFGSVDALLAEFNAAA